MLQIHERIKKAREDAGLTQDELAGRLNIKRSTYQYWEEKTPGIEKVKAVAKALGLAEDYFFVIDENVPYGTLGEPDDSEDDITKYDKNLSVNSLILEVLNEQKETGKRTNQLLEVLTNVLQRQEKDVVSKLGTIEANLITQGSLLDSVQASILTQSDMVLEKLGDLADLISPSSSPGKQGNKASGGRKTKKSKGNGEP